MATTITCDRCGVAQDGSIKVQIVTISTHIRESVDRRGAGTIVKQRDLCSQCLGLASAVFSQVISHADVPE